MARAAGSPLALSVGPCRELKGDWGQMGGNEINWEGDMKG